MFGENKTKAGEGLTSLILSIGVILALLLIVYFLVQKYPTGTYQESDTFTPDTQGDVSMVNTGPENILEEGKNYSAVLHTDQGDILVELFEDKTPITVNNFVSLANTGFYDGVRFHRVIKEFMIQAGDPLSKDDTQMASWGSGGPGYKFDDEPFDGEYTRGVIAMANAGPNTNGSQFFIMHQTNQLPKNYVIFGTVSDDASMAVVDRIATSEVEANSSGEVSKPVTPITINSVDVLVN